MSAWIAATIAFVLGALVAWNVRGKSRRLSARIKRLMGRVVEQPPPHRKKTRTTLVSKLPSNSVGAEIGVWKGEFSEQLLTSLDPRKLYLVDQWRFEPGTGVWWGGIIAKSQADMDTIRNGVVEKFRGDPRVAIHAMSSATFFSEKHDSLDWIYIDGNHTRDAVLADLRGAWDLTKPGGIICGDDLRWSGVRHALEHFCAEHCLGYEVDEDAQFLLRKPLKVPDITTEVAA
jgi:hypothetical protein